MQPANEHIILRRLNLYFCPLLLIPKRDKSKAMAGQTQNPTIDESPISPISPLERRNSLEKHLQQRPDPQDLKDRNILLNTAAAPSVFPHPDQFLFPSSSVAFIFSLVEDVKEANIGFAGLSAHSNPQLRIWSVNGRRTV